MTLKAYSVTLTKENVEKAKEIIKPSGGKLSPVMDLLLEEWLNKQEVEEIEEEESGCSG